MFENVIVGLDGRQGGRDAIALAGRLAALGATVTFAHVYGVPVSASVRPLVLRVEMEAAERLLAQEIDRASFRPSQRRSTTYRSGMGCTASPNRPQPICW